MSCYVCGSTNVEYHHALFGAKYRKLADKYGLIVALCPEHHRGKYSPHFDRELDLELKRKAQEEFEAVHGHEAWMRVFGRNYRED